MISAKLMHYRQVGGEKIIVLFLSSLIAFLVEPLHYWMFSLGITLGSISQTLPTLKTNIFPISPTSQALVPPQKPGTHSS
jgi:hypothetical protein